jgi:hypothetical protein
MRKRLLGIAGIGLLFAAAATPGYAQVNCGIVNKDLKMGRTAQDISERMMISVDDVKKCEAEAKKDSPAAAPAAAGEKPAAGAAGGAAGSGAGAH